MYLTGTVNSIDLLILCKNQNVFVFHAVNTVMFVNNVLQAIVLNNAFPI